MINLQIHNYVFSVTSFLKNAVGKPRLKIVNAAREAIRLNDGSIFKAIRSGTELDKPSDPAVDLIPSA